MSHDYEPTQKRKSPIEIMPRPQFSVAEIRSVLHEQYGLDGELQQLISERDQNFRVTSSDGRRYVFKIANAAEPRNVTDFQIQALLHIEAVGCPVDTPRIIRTSAGTVATKVGDGGDECVCRLVSFVPGIPMSTVKPGPELAGKLGASFAALDCALHGYEHDNDQSLLLWNLLRAMELRDLQSGIASKDLRTSVGACLDDFERNVLPRIPLLRSQVIHGDLNPDNVLVMEDGRDSIAGVIDFGDIAQGPIVFEVAIAASYLRAGADPAALVGPFVAAYNNGLTLDVAELEMLFDLVRTRLATTITIQHWRGAIIGEDDAYARANMQGGSAAASFLARLDSMTRDAFTDRLLRACGH